MLNAQAVHRRARRVLPEVLATSGVALRDASDNGLAALLFPLRRPSSGSIAFHLCEDSARQLQADPDAFLERARVAAGCHATPVYYRAWRRIVLPFGEAWFSARRDGRGLLVVVPSERWVLYLWQDR